MATSSDRIFSQKLFQKSYKNVTAYGYSLIKHKTQKAVAQAALVPQLFGFYTAKITNLFLTYGSK